MALTEKAKPESFTPAFNEVNYLFDSSNKLRKGFRYRVDLYNALGIMVDTFPVAPRPGDGYGEVKLRSYLDKYLGYDGDPVGSDSEATNSYYRYSLKMGEEYTTELALSTIDMFEDAGGLLQFTLASAMTLVVGDSIVINDVDNYLENVLCQVVGVVSSTVYKTSIPWVIDYGSTSQNGVVAFSDSRKTIVHNMLVYNNVYVFNSALRNLQFRDYVQSEYVLTESDINSKILMDAPVYGLQIGESQPFWALTITNQRSDVYCYFSTSNGDVFRKQVGLDTDGFFRRIGIGTSNTGTLEVVSGTLPMIKDSTVWYEVDIRDEVGAELTRLYHFDIDRRCSISDVVMCWVDRCGATPSIAFAGRQYERLQAVNSTYLGQLGRFEGGKYTFDLTDRGETMLSASESEVFTLNTLPLNEAMRNYVLTAINSPMVSLRINGEWYSARVLDAEKDLSNRVNTVTMPLQMQFKLSNENNINV